MSRQTEILTLLTRIRKQKFPSYGDALTEQYDMLIILLPGDEETLRGMYGGSRGLIHVSSTGHWTLSVRSVSDWN
jgi:hypothetical protein